MKIKITQEMRKKMWMAIIVIAAGITIFFAFDKFSLLWNGIKSICSLTTPFILGFAIAFLLNKPMEFIEHKLLGKLPLKKEHRRNIAAILAVLLGIIIVGAFLAMLIPQLMESILFLVKAFPGYMEDTQDFINEFIEENGIAAEEITKMLSQNNLLTRMTEFVTDAVPKMLKYTYQFGSTLLDIVLGIMSGLYMLIDKERLMGYAKRINYALFPIEIAEYLHRMTLASGDIFNNFIVGKAIDSLIIGILCYIGSLIFQFPYALLLSVFVGVTNMIPVFGPFIGAVPGIVILFIIHPITALYFALFIFVLQQFDGNILGPLILGDKLGLPSIGILFSVCVGGGLFGIIGMFIGVPCFAVIYAAVREFVNYRLKQKKLSLEQLSFQAQKEAKQKEEEFEEIIRDDE